MTQQRLESFLSNAGRALRDCLFEDPDGLLLGLGILSALLVFWIGYELIFDPYATAVAARLDALSISPEKWIGS